MLKHRQLFKLLGLLILLTVCLLFVALRVSHTNQFRIKANDLPYPQQQQLYWWNTSILSYRRIFSGKSSSSEKAADSKGPLLLNMATLSIGDFNRLIDLNDFEFIMNQVFCKNAISSRVANSGQSGSKIIGPGTDAINQNPEPLLLIIVHSAPANFRKRLLIRETWGSLKDQNSYLVFLLGAVNTTHQQRSLQMENNEYKDIVQGNFIDAYRNLTYKHVMGLKWSLYYCPVAKYVLKSDDDVFINTPSLLKYLRMNASRHDLLFCRRPEHFRVMRDKESKWYVSEKEYPGSFYPDYCSGFAIIYSQDVVLRLYNEAQKAAYYWIDDVHVTGVLSKKANITITSLEPFIMEQSQVEDILTGKTDIDKFLVSISTLKYDEKRSLWNLVRAKYNITGRKQ